jgi:tetraacyldisaccharide 4'-kinase
LRSNRSGQQWLVDSWYRRSPWLLLLLPLSLLYRVATSLRRLLYRAGLLKMHRLPVPVIVVGNLAVGGTGKTPLVAWLAEYLKQAGYRPGIVARGYGGRAGHWPQQVRPDSDPVMVGDEAVLLAARSGCPMAVGPDRVAAARSLLEHRDCDLILSDDGLQHYALQRDIEIAVIDGVRRFGNGFYLPAGPLREPVKRLARVDLVVVNGLGNRGEYPMTMRLNSVHELQDGEAAARDLRSFRGQSVHAVAGIGNPERFFAALRQAGLRLEEHIFPDHHLYARGDLEFGDGRPVIMTEKDAVKCRGFGMRNCWYAPATIEMPREFATRVSTLLTDAA